MVVIHLLHALTRYEKNTEIFVNKLVFIYVHAAESYQI